MTKNTILNTHQTPLSIANGGSGQNSQNWPAAFCTANPLSGGSIGAAYNVSSVSSTATTCTFNFSYTMDQGNGNIFLCSGQKLPNEFVYISSSSTTSVAIKKYDNASFEGDSIYFVAYQAI